MHDDPIKGDYLRFVKKNRWDSVHLRKHIGDVGEVTHYLPASRPSGANQVRLVFQCEERAICAEYVAMWRCNRELPW